MPAPSVPSATAPTFRIDIPLLPESAAGNALQFIDLLRSANVLASLRAGAASPRFAWRLLDAEGLPITALPGPLAAYSQAAGGAHDAPSGSRAFALFLPSLHAADIPLIRSVVSRHQRLSRLVGLALDQGQKVLTVGNGAWLAASSGRLQDRQASLPWFYMAGFERDFPEIRLIAGQDVTDDGPWLSCALPHGLSDMATALVRHAMGDELAQVCASVFHPDPERARAALQANAQQHIPATRDSTLARAIAYMESHLDEPYSLARLAEAAAVSPRTLLRHFQLELSQSPLDHLHSLRCARAKVLLEVTLESVPSIAVACGYSDPAAFRRIFVRHTGMAPAEYRKRHALRAPRRRWRVDVS
ncbi:MAG: helix-turn-helix domain-containing protein [Acidovorax sp.]|uniref:GlxA family transcriptional regulator n=1 Tax=Acidovorax sp. TaxID=1872122 RepID=UPI00263639E8|nr:helix-turn-helix domain-containing protein [Acidovorax sp.]MDH4416085.1 helix-turn-helix domain-containing protein [Acidovorax sp.]